MLVFKKKRLLILQLLNFSTWVFKISMKWYVIGDGITRFLDVFIERSSIYSKRQHSAFYMKCLSWFAHNVHNWSFGRSVDRSIIQKTLLVWQRWEQLYAFDFNKKHLNVAFVLHICNWAHLPNIMSRTLSAKHRSEKVVYVHASLDNHCTL